MKFKCLVCQKQKDEVEAKKIPIDVKRDIYNNVAICDTCLSQPQFDRVLVKLREIDLCKIGKHNNLEIPKGSKLEEQFKKGLSIEFEHTDNPILAQNIEKDHLVEIEDYYDRIEVLEMPEFWDLINKRKFTKLLKKKQQKKN